ncbi:MAG: SLBB domain-containing protein [Flavobacteriales bacterium]
MSYAQTGGIDPSILLNSEVKKLSLDAGALQSIGKGTSSSIVKAPVTDTVDQKVDNTPKKAREVEATDSIQNLADYNNTFGKSFLNGQNLKVYKSASHLVAPDDYILGPGDELNIAVWGNAEVSLSERVGDDGAIYPKLVGKIFLNGMRLGDARKLIKSKFGAVYDLRNSQFALELKYSKVIKVNIVGEVITPGTYSVSSLNSAFNVLALAGGINQIGSVRNIVIKREGKVVKVLDVYKFLMDPTYNADFFLKENDYIIVQAAGKIVFAKGKIGRRGKYELLKNEGLAELITYAGNLDPNANKEVAHAIRVESNHLVVKDLDLKSALLGKNVPLIDGDTVSFNSVNLVLRNYVYIKGAIESPGKYQYRAGESLLQLINRAGGLRFDAFLGRAYLMRTYIGGEKKYFHINLKEILKDSSSSGNLLLEDLDQITIFSTTEFHDDFVVSIYGAVRSPKEVPYSENLTLQDLIFLSGGLKYEAANNRIEISRMVNFTENKDGADPLQYIVETYNVGDDLEISKLQEVLLKPQDKVYVRFIEDFQYQRLVTLTGEFKYPGTYALLNDQETIKEVVERAGGFNEGAFLRGAKMIRAEGEKGELVVDLDALFNKNIKQYNYVMMNGDSLIVPKIDDIIAISGEVSSAKVAGRAIQNSPYTKGKRAKYYVKEYAGGFTDNADRGKVYVISSSGKVKKSRNFFLFHTYPKVKRGDRIRVALKTEKVKKDSEPTNWNHVIENLTVKLTGLMTLYLLTQKVFTK